MGCGRLLSLLGFEYLRRRRILTLAVILTLASMLFSITAISLLSFYRGFNAYLGEGEDVVAVYNRKSRTPFTGLVPMYLASKIASIDGVLTSSPEALAPCILRGESIFVRGVLPDEFCKINPLTIVAGEMLDKNDLNLATVGNRLAERLRLNVGERLLLLDVQKDRYLELTIKGIYESKSAIDDECLVPIYVGQWLRGTDYNHVTIIRAKIDKEKIGPDEIFDEIADEASVPSPSEGGDGGWQNVVLPPERTSFDVDDVSVKEAQIFMEEYLEKYGVTRDALLILSVLVFFFASASVADATRTIMIQHMYEIEVLSSIGASRRTIRIDLFLKMLGWSLVSSTVGIILATATLALIQLKGYPQILSHKVFFQLDPQVVAINIFLVFILVALSMLRTDLRGKSH